MRLSYLYIIIQLQLFQLCSCTKIALQHREQVITETKASLNPQGDSNFRTVNVEWILPSNHYRLLEFKLFVLPFCGFNFKLILKIANDEKEYCGFDMPASIKSDEDISIKLVGSYQALSSNFMLKFLYRPLNVKCGYSVFMSAGGINVLTSPNYPNHYMSNASCIWQVTVTDDPYARIDIDFVYFNLQLETDGNRCRDYLKIYDSKSTTEKDVKGVFCGLNGPQGLRSRGNVLTLFFSSDSHITSKGFEVKLTAVKTDEPLDGLQSVAAIFGGISFFVFVGLLLCSIVYKRWSRTDNPDGTCNNDSNHDDGIPDVIQAAAPPSYNIVMAEPDNYPTTPIDTPRQSPLLIRTPIPIIEPPEYTVVSLHENNTTDHLNVLPPLPSYNAVSESEDEWFQKKKLKNKKTTANTNIAMDTLTTGEQPPSYEAVTSEGSDMDVIMATNSRKKHSKLKSRSHRSSISSMPQAQRHKSVDKNNDNDSDTDSEAESNLQRSLSDIESSDREIEDDPFEDIEPPKTPEECHQTHEISATHYSSDSPSLTSPSLHRISFISDRNRSSSYNDLARVAILNSSIRHAEFNDSNTTTHL